MAVIAFMSVSVPVVGIGKLIHIMYQGDKKKIHLMYHYVDGRSSGPLIAYRHGVVWLDHAYTLPSRSGRSGQGVMGRWGQNGIGLQILGARGA